MCQNTYKKGAIYVGKEGCSWLYSVPHLKTTVRTVRPHLSVHICSGCTADTARVEDKWGSSSIVYSRLLNSFQWKLHNICENICIYMYVCLYIYVYIIYVNCTIYVRWGSVRSHCIQYTVELPLPDTPQSCGILQMCCIYCMSLYSLLIHDFCMYVTQLT